MALSDVHQHPWNPYLAKCKLDIKFVILKLIMFNCSFFYIIDRIKDSRVYTDVNRTVHVGSFEIMLTGYSSVNLTILFSLIPWKLIIMTVLIFRNFLSLGEVNKGLQKSLLNPVLSTFSEALVASLSVPDSQTSDSGLKTEVHLLFTKYVLVFLNFERKKIYSLSFNDTGKLICLRFSVMLVFYKWMKYHFVFQLKLDCFL